MSAERRGPWNSLSQIVGRIEDLESAVSALLELDWQNSVLSQFDPTAALPVGPSTGDRYIATATANGWTDTYIYEWDGAAWDETIPNEGYAAWVEDENKVYVFDSAAWVAIGSTTDHNILANLQGGAASEYYHLTQAIHDALFSASPVIGLGSAAGTSFEVDYGANTIKAFISNTEKMSVTSEGITVGDGTDTASIGFDQTIANEMQIYNLVNGGRVEIRGKDAGGLLVPLANFDPLGSSVIRAVGNDILTVNPGSITIRDAANDALDLAPGAAALIASRYDGGTIQIEGDHVADGSQAIMFLGDPDGAAELYHAGVKALETTVSGITVSESASAQTLSLFVQGDGDIVLRNDTDAKDVYIQGYKAGSVLSTIMHMTPDGPINFYNNGVKAFNTMVGGIELTGAGFNDIQISSSSGNLIIDNNNEGGLISITGQETGGATNIMITSDPDGAAELYYAGVKMLETTSLGGIIVGNGTDSTQMIYAGPDFIIKNTNHGGSVVIRAENLSGLNNAMAKFDPDGVSELYYAGLKSFETGSIGVNVYEGANLALTLYRSGTDTVVRSNQNSDHLQLVGKDSGGINTTLFSGDPDGRASLYHSGVLKFESHPDGLIVRSGNKLYLEGSTAQVTEMSMSVNNLIIQNRANGGTFELLLDDTGGTPRTIIKGSGDGAAELYYAGVKTLETQSGGIDVGNASGTVSLFILNPGTAELRNNLFNGVFQITGDDGVTPNVPMFYGDPAAGVILYDQGNPSIATNPAGAQIYNSAGKIFRFDYSTDELSMWNTANGDVLIKVGATPETALKAVYNGAVELYHNNVKKLETTATGIDVDGDITADAFLYDPTGLADVSAQGEKVTMTVDVNATGFGAVLYMAADFHLEEADADAAATMPVIAMALESGTGSKRVLLKGFVRNDAWNWVAGPVYVSTTTGAMTQTAPSGSGDRVQRVGWAYSADIMFFDPDSTDIGVA